MVGLTIEEMLEEYCSAQLRRDLDGSEIFRKMIEFYLSMYGDVTIDYNEVGYVGFWRHKRWLWKQKREYIGYYNPESKTLVLPSNGDG